MIIIIQIIKTSQNEIFYMNKFTLVVCSSTLLISACSSTSMWTKNDSPNYSTEEFRSAKIACNYNSLPPLGNRHLNTLPNLGRTGATTGNGVLGARTSDVNRQRADIRLAQRSRDNLKTQTALIEHQKQSYTCMKNHGFEKSRLSAKSTS